MVDNIGNVYIADVNFITGTSRVLKETPSAGGYIQTIAPSNSIGALDERGNVYIADSSNYRVLKEGFADPPSLSFALATVRTTSIDSPKTVTVENVGNADLTFPLPGTGYNPSVPRRSIGTPTDRCNISTTSTKPTRHSRRWHFGKICLSY